MIQPFLRDSAWPSVRRSRSPASVAAADFSETGLSETGLAGDIGGTGAGFARAFAARAISLPLRQNAKRMARPRERHEQNSLSTVLHRLAIFRTDTRNEYREQTSTQNFTTEAGI